MQQKVKHNRMDKQMRNKKIQGNFQLDILNEPSTGK